MWRGWAQTRDHVIPYKMFALYLEAAEAIDAVTELRDARAFALGYSMARAGKDARVRAAQRSLIRRAYPEVTMEGNEV